MRAMKSFYATILDATFLARALCLYQSLITHNHQAGFGFYCMDNLSAELLEKLRPEQGYIVPHEAFASLALQAIRANRSRAEYCWTS